MLNSSLNKNIAKLLVFFVVLSTVFIHWPGYRSSTHYFLSNSIVTENNFDINEFQNFTSDRSLINQNYYSDKAPGLSLIGSFPLSVVGGISENRTSVGPEDTVVDRNINKYWSGPFLKFLDPGGGYFLGYILLTLVLSVLPAALSILVFYKLTSFFTDTEKYKIVSTFIYSFGTLLLPFSTVLYSMSLTLLLFNLFLYFVLRFREDGESLDLILVLTLGGFCVVTNYLSLIPVAAFSLFLFYHASRRRIFLFMVFGILSILPLVLYNISLTGSPLDMPVFHIDPSVYSFPGFDIGKAKGDFLMMFGPFRISEIFPTVTPIAYYTQSVFGLSVSPFKGLFFFYPVFLVSVPGFFYMYRRDPKLTFPFLSSVILLFILNTLLSVWWAGNAFGPMYLFLLSTLLTLPMIDLFENVNMGRYVKIIVIILVSLSIFHNVLAFGSEWVDPVEDVGDLALGNQEPVLYSHYLPSLIETGFNPRFLESLYYEGLNFDVRDIPYSRGTARPVIANENIPLFKVGDSVLRLNVKFLSVILLGFLCIGLFWGELHLIGNGRVLLIFLVLLLVSMTVLSLNTVSSHYSDGWYPQEKVDGNYTRYMSNSSEYMFYGGESEGFLTLDVSSFEKPRILEIYHNGGLIYRDEVLPGYRKINIKTQPGPGTDRFEFKSPEGCDRVEDSGRCISFNFKDIEFTPIDGMGEDFVHHKNWFREETFRNSSYRFMSQNATSYIYSPGDQSGIITYEAKSYDRPRNISIFLDGENIDRRKVGLERKRYFTEVFKLDRGSHRLTFVSESGCDESTVSDRCLSFQFYSMGRIGPDSIYDQMFFNEGWYPEERVDGRNIRFMKNSSDLHLYSFDNDSKLLSFSAHSYSDERTLKISHGSENISREIGIGWQDIVIPSFELERGKNVIDFEAVEGCKYSEESDRCLSFGFSNFNITPIKDISRKVYFMSEGWFPEENINGEDVRWMSNQSTVLFVTDDGGEYIVRVSAHSFKRPRKLSIGSKNRTVLENAVGIQFDEYRSSTFEVDRGVNKIRFSVEPECEISENSDRCLGMVFNEISFERV